ncbi:MAG TPA: Dam family site-specific DNA-(adenine-N6)-methyltransferase [Vicinamibacterales bacterium]|jgi:DNA adenine methylase|nr:Dam family site-specific DNA-(adenine-N6)-methyltransferase [Vicinamibacterales bacterium]
MIRRSARGATDTAVRPILKWAGGKRQLLPQLRPYYPVEFTRYVEPFLGSGAVFLDCHNRGLLEGREVRLSDINADIIGCYRMVRDAVDDTIASLAALEDGHRRRGRQHFYEIRDGAFNRLRESAASGDPAAHYTPELAAMLIYLNRTGYNGLFRLNSRGAFNVPAGRYTSPLICDAANLRRLSAALAKPELSLEVEPFERALKAAKAADFIYLDPPYAPVSATARFTSYTAGGFGTEEQARLQQAVIRLADAGAWILLSNSDAPDIRRLYADSPEAGRAGLRAQKVSARRAINSRASRRGAVKEYLITNVR